MIINTINNSNKIPKHQTVNYLNDLNEAQRAAVLHTEGASLVIAGAGSGKTRVLTYRIAHLLQQGKKAGNILALTFTNKAAREMKERIASIVGKDVAGFLWMGTFHSIFARILRSESVALGYPSNFTIYDTTDSQSLLKTIIKELNLGTDVYKPNEVLGRISKAKNNLITPVAYANNDQLMMSDKLARRPEIHTIYKRYVERCFNAHAMDFDDLLLKTNVLFRDNPDILEKYQMRFSYILVDEYQDTNFSQYLIIKKLSAMHKNVCVVGDDAQSIYSFRGAKIENILSFQADYPDCKMFKLEQNYRSTQNIVNAANDIIAKNKHQIPKEVFSKKEVGNKIIVHQTANEQDEGYLVANTITDSRLTYHFDYKDYAILYRTNAQSRIFEEALRRRNIPYKVYGGLSFYQRKEIKDLLSYFRLTINHNDDEAFKRIINYPKRGIGDTTVDKIEEIASNQGLSLWQTVKRLTEFNAAVNTGAISKIAGFLAMIEGFRKKLTEIDAFTLASEIASVSGVMKDLYNDKAPEGVSRYENIQELLNGIKLFTNQQNTDFSTAYLDQFMQDVSLMTNDDKNTDEDPNKVVLMTIHSAKGLEFKNVFIVGVEEDLFPSKMSSQTPEELEEERRLFYVAMTRAEQNLNISYAKIRFRWGELNYCKPSRFISEIAPIYLEMPYDSDNDDSFADFDDERESFFPPAKKTPTFSAPSALQSKEKPQPTPIQLPKVSVLPNKPANFKKVSAVSTSSQSEKNATTSELIGLKIGTTVLHERFGKGKVTNLEGIMPNVKATIVFEVEGQKQILLKFAKLQIVS